MQEDVSPEKSLRFDPLLAKFGFKYHQLKGKYTKPLPASVMGSDEQYSVNKFECDMCHDDFDTEEAIPVEHGRKVVCMDCAKKFYGVSPNVTEGFKEWLEAFESKKPRSAEKLDHKEKKSNGSRMMTNDLSKDYFGNIAKLGDGLGPFKVLKRRGKSVAPVAH